MPATIKREVCRVGQHIATTFYGNECRNEAYSYDGMYVDGGGTKRVLFHFMERVVGINTPTFKPSIHIGIGDLPAKVQLGGYKFVITRFEDNGNTMHIEFN